MPEPHAKNVKCSTVRKKQVPLLVFGFTGLSSMNVCFITTAISIRNLVVEVQHASLGLAAPLVAFLTALPTFTILKNAVQDKEESFFTQMIGAGGFDLHARATDAVQGRGIIPHIGDAFPLKRSIAVVERFEM
jgi:hypothetical protein